MIAIPRVVNVHVNLRCGVFEMLPFLRDRFWTTGATRYRTVTFIFIFLVGEKKTLIFFPRFSLARCHCRSVLTNGWLVTRRFCLMLIMKEIYCHTCYMNDDSMIMQCLCHGARSIHAVPICCSCSEILFLNLPWNNDLPAILITSVFSSGVYTLDLTMLFRVHIMLSWLQRGHHYHNKVPQTS